MSSVEQNSRRLDYEELKKLEIMGLKFDELRDVIRFAENHGWRPSRKEPTWEIIPLKGRYCARCTESLRNFRLALYSIIPMCHADLDQFLHNGDMDTVRRMMDQKETR